MFVYVLLGLVIVFALAGAAPFMLGRNGSGAATVTEIRRHT